MVLKFKLLNFPPRNIIFTSAKFKIRAMFWQAQHSNSPFFIRNNKCNRQKGKHFPVLTLKNSPSNPDCEQILCYETKPITPTSVPHQVSQHAKWLLQQFKFKFKFKSNSIHSLFSFSPFHLSH
jgi:hypothetical protein